jgi:hypothetical protein
MKSEGKQVGNMPNLYLSWRENCWLNIQMLTVRSLILLVVRSLNEDDGFHKKRTLSPNNIRE